MTVKRARRMDGHVQTSAKMTSRPGRSRRLFAALWILAAAFFLLWGLVVFTSTMTPAPAWHSNHVARNLIEGEHIERSSERVAADVAAMGRILLATNQRGCQTGAVFVFTIHSRPFPGTSMSSLLICS
jgi:hypothetical protein